MDLITLCRKIHLQEEIQKEVIIYYQTTDLTPMYPLIHQLRHMETEAQAREALTEHLGSDPQNIKILTCMLLCATDIYPWYQKKGIPEAIFLDTMSCFTRFIHECKQITGTYAFDREWWTSRQISGRLFRLGELEYEMKASQHTPVLSIHIPSDSILTKENIDRSMEQAVAFFAEHFPEYKQADYICHSWLLAPELSLFLPADSNIMAFQRRFAIEKVEYDSREYIEWVFKTRTSSIHNFPEETRLQKEMKRYLLNGGKIGTGLGVWIG